MEANKAPEKIYLFENPITEVPDDKWLSKRSDKNDIEYVRTDAFIERAKEYLKNKFADDISFIAGGAFYINFSTAIENFANYMKGE